MSNSYKVQQKSWIHPLKKWFYLLGLEEPILFIQKSTIKYYFSVQSCWFLLHILEMPVTESPTAVAVQDYTQLNDLGLNYYIFMVIMLTKLCNRTWFNFILEFCSLMLHFIFHIFSLYCCCCCFIGKSKIDKLLLPKVVHLMVK